MFILIFFFYKGLFKKFKIKKVCNLKFYCSKRCEHCCLFNNNYFEMTTCHPSTWIHIIFLYSQVFVSSCIYIFLNFTSFLIKIGKIDSAKSSNETTRQKIPRTKASIWKTERKVAFHRSGDVIFSATKSKILIIYI